MLDHKKFYYYFYFIIIIQYLEEHLRGQKLIQSNVQSKKPQSIA